MPTYEYRCEACGHEFDEFQSITASPLRKCPACSKLRLKRLIGIGAGIIFKGSGFYETDYRSEGYKKAAKADKECSSGGGDGAGEKKSESTSSDKPAAAAEAKPAAKAETKPEKKSPAKDKPAKS